MKTVILAYALFLTACTSTLAPHTEYRLRCFAGDRVVYDAPSSGRAAADTGVITVHARDPMTGRMRATNNCMVVPR